MAGSNVNSKFDALCGTQSKVDRSGAAASASKVQNLLVYKMLFILNRFPNAICNIIYLSLHGGAAHSSAFYFCCVAELFLLLWIGQYGK